MTPNPTTNHAGSFSKHKQKIVKNDKARKTTPVPGATAAGAAGAGAGGSGKGAGGGGGKGMGGGKGQGGMGFKKDFVEMEPRPSALSNLSLMTDEEE